MQQTTACIRILIMQANPAATVRLETAAEQRNLDAALWAALNRDLFDTPVLAAAARIGDLLPALRRHRPHILHFMGHGDGAGGLLLHAPDDDTVQCLTASALLELLRAYQAEASEPLRLVVLAGCETASTAALIGQVVDGAIGMTGDIGDVAVRDIFTPAFYAALGDGRSVANAVTSTQAELRSQGYSADAEMVALHTRDGLAETQLQPQAWLTRPVQLSELHREYLRSWFGQPWATVALADIMEERSDRPSLLDLYVPLPVTCELVIKVEEQRISDWWVKVEAIAVDEVGNPLFPKRSAAVSLPTEAPRPRRWVELNVGEAELTQIVAGIQRKIEQRQAASETAKDGEHTWFMEAHDAASVQPRFVLLGDPGSGKSSFLRHLALCLAGELRRQGGEADTPTNASLAALRDWLLGAYTPIYIEMRSLVSTVFPTLPAAADQPAPLPTVQSLWRYVREQILETGLAGFEVELRQLCAHGQAILLLDGLDEIPQADDPRRRDQIKSFVAALVKSYPALRVVVTSRPYAYRVGEWALTGFGHTLLQPLHLSRLQELAQALFAVATPDQGEQEATAFVQALRDHPHMEPGFHANPLFFTLLAALWLNAPDRRLPATQAELYRRAVDLLLGRWTRRRAPESSVADKLGVNAAELRSVLETLACTIHGQSGAGQDATVFHGKELLGVLLEAGFPVGLRDVPTYLEQQAGILVAPSPHHFYFSHRSFQEHLAACELICHEPTKHRPPVAAERRFPHGLLQRLQTAPDLWQNVTHLAADELLTSNRETELWALLGNLCQPYLTSAATPQTAHVALVIAQRHDLFAIERHDWRSGLLTPLRHTAQRILTDTANFTPTQRNMAGEVLGRRPEHDDRPGVGCRTDGLPNLDWVKIPEMDEPGKREFIYQEDERRVERTFWIARYPLTYAQFQAFVDAPDGFDNPVWWAGLAAPASDKANPGEQRFPFWNHPRANVSWYDAIAYCRWLTAQAQAQTDLLPLEMRGQRHWRITLPTEWQWEKAARGHDGRRYPWGNEYVSGHANIDETSNRVGPHYLQKTSAVGMYLPGASPYGVLDMSGNVWEWCLNEYERPDQIQEEGDATRVVRGGSWHYDGDNAAAAVRVRYHLNPRYVDVGVRLVVVGFVPVG